MNSSDSIEGIRPAALYTALGIGCYWGWVKTNFYNVAFFPTGMSAHVLSLCNTSAHLLALIILGFFIWKGCRAIVSPTALSLGGAASIAGVVIVHAGASQAWSPAECAGGLMAGAGSAFLLVGWCASFASLASDGERQTVMFSGILAAVVAFIIVDSLPDTPQLLMSSACLAGSTVAICAALSRNNASSIDLRDNARENPEFAPSGGARLQAASLFLCTFLFAVPLTYLRASAENGIRVTIFATMLILLGIIFALDWWLRKRAGAEVLSKLLVLLTSGGMILLPFLMGREFFFSAVLIMTGGYVFRAYIYPEFVVVGRLLNIPGLLVCVVGTVFLDAGSVLGIGLREFLRILPAEHFTNTTLAIVYALFLAGFLIISYRTHNRSIPDIAANAVRAQDNCMPGTHETSRPARGSNHPMINGIEQQCTLLAERFGLSSREQQIASLLIRGRSIQSIAEEEVVSQNTVKTHVSHIYQKCDVHSREQLAKLAENPKS
ncbi:response regulator transcription factor [Adlercreutzia equolifaciens]|uniref:response regulator transcription factor n=1 Tax=Adlercreutzia equolifaciens TaxID=446660 RepID=UPI00266CC094|nr:helix-turn-helix transcriptional regulator [Adlercreutzia equolifaciens]